MKQHEDLMEILERWYEFKSSGEISRRQYNQIYDDISAIIRSIVLSNVLFRNNGLTKQDYEEIRDDIFLKLDRRITTVYPRLVESGRNLFYGYCRTMVYNYIVTTYKLKDKKDGINLDTKELKDETKPKDWDGNVQPIITTNVRTEKERLYEFLASGDVENKLFQNLMKWMEWKGSQKDKVEYENLLPTSHIQRSGFVALDPGDIKLYPNHLSLLVKYDLWMNHDPEARRMMWYAIDEMCKSETGSSNIPMVGAVLTDGDGNLISKAHVNYSIGRRCCICHLLEHETDPKFIREKIEISGGKDQAKPVMASVLNLREPTLYITVEPSPGGEDNECNSMDRIILSGIKTVYLGLKNPHRANAGATAFQLKAAGIKVKYFYQDFTLEIIKSKNKQGEMQNLKYIQQKQQFYMEEQPDLFHHIILQRSPAVDA